jgi:hypothetical protein
MTRLCFMYRKTSQYQSLKYSFSAAYFISVSISYTHQDFTMSQALFKFPLMTSLCSFIIEISYTRFLRIYVWYQCWCSSERQSSYHFFRTNSYPARCIIPAPLLCYLKKNIWIYLDGKNTINAFYMYGSSFFKLPGNLRRQQPYPLHTSLIHHCEHHKASSWRLRVQW